MKSKRIYIIILLTAVLTSCAEIDKVKTLFDVKYEVSESFKKNPPKIVAILPFENLSENPEASAVVRRIFYSQFSPKRFIDIEISQIDSELKKKHINTPINMKKFDAKFIGEMLRADALIYGRVTYYKKEWWLFYSYRRVGLSVEMLDAKTDKVLWMADHKLTSYGGEMPGTTYATPFTIVTSLTIGPIKALWDYFLKDSEYIKITNELCREIVETIPEP